MRKVVDVDEQLLRLAEERARRDGRSLDALIAEGLQKLLVVPEFQLKEVGAREEMVDADDAFFAALDEIRALGRSSSVRRQIELS